MPYSVIPIAERDVYDSYILILSHCLYFLVSGLVR
ncbi:hypothetical protein PXNS11_460013 [Stutzerimonas xanthomarina]|nr:hypothetical protein PXNS11_460013 [Stutzerimonas xanthomarina]